MMWKYALRQLETLDHYEHEATSKSRLCHQLSGFSCAEFVFRDLAMERRVAATRWRQVVCSEAWRRWNLHRKKDGCSNT